MTTTVRAPRTRRRPARPRPRRDSTTAAEFEAYIGLTVEAAGAKADGDGRPWRVVMEDGVAKPVTMDFNEQRLNFTVVDGKVTNVTTG